MTWRDLIVFTLQDLGVYGPGDSISPEDFEVALQGVNDWIDALKADGLVIFQNARTLWTLTTAASYTVGSGGTVNVARPPSSKFIFGLAYLNNGVTPAYEFKLGPPISLQQYRNITNKTFTAAYPVGFYYEPTIVGGLGTLYPYPQSDGTLGSTLQGVMYSGVPIEEVTSSQAAAAMAVPPGYRLLYRKLLRLELAAPFKIPIDPGWVTERNDAMARVKVTNELPADMGFGVAGALFSSKNAGHSNIYTGDE